MNTCKFLVSLAFVTVAVGAPMGESGGHWYPQHYHYQQQQQPYYMMHRIQRADQEPQASYEGNDYSGWGASGGGEEHQQSYPISEHVEVSKPEIIPQYKYVQVPIHKTINFNVPHPILVPVPQPYPVQVPVNKPVAVPIIKEITIPIEKVVPYPVEKKVPYPVEKKVPYTVIKHVTVHVDKPYPVKIPVIKTVYHTSKGHGGGHH